MSKIQSVDAWLSIVSQIHYETNGFKLNISKASDYQVCQIKPIDESIIQLAPSILKIVNDKDKARFRNCIVYMTALRQKQGEAWERQNESFEEEQRQLSMDIIELQARLKSKSNGGHNIATTQNNL